MSGQYTDNRKRLTAFVLNEIDNGQMSDLEIAKMLLDVSMNYLKYRSMEKRNCFNENEAV